MHTLPHPHIIICTHCFMHTLPRPHIISSTHFLTHTLPHAHIASSTHCLIHTLPHPHITSSTHCLFHLYILSTYWIIHIYILSTHYLINILPHPHISSSTHFLIHTLPHPHIYLIHTLPHPHITSSTHCLIHIYILSTHYLINILPHPTVDHGNKKLWSLIRAKRRDTTGVAPLKENGELVQQPLDKANVLNHQFLSAFSPITTEPLPYTQMQNITVTVRGVEQLLLNLKPYKAAGPDAILPRTLKDFATEIAPVLTFIFNKSLSSSTIPDDWRTANVTPIFKKGERYLPSNYRPISLTGIWVRIPKCVPIDKYHVFVLWTDLLWSNSIIPSELIGKWIDDSFLSSNMYGYVYIWSVD